MTYILLKDRGLLHLNQISVNYFYFLDLKLVQFRYFCTFAIDKSNIQLMTLVFITIILIGYFLIATEKFTNVNKAAVAIFVGTLGWILYICYGSDFVMGQHAKDYASFLDGAPASSAAVKQYIFQNLFLKYVGRASEIVLFLLSTMTIVEILQNNGCFDFISQMLRTRSGKRMLWTLSAITFLISANLDNLTATVMMLTIMHAIVSRQRQRAIFGCAIVLSANCGGALTVIGDPTGLVLWNIGAVTATNYSLTMALPCLIAWLFPILWLQRGLPRRIETEWITMPYRGDDTNLNLWQRALMLFVGIGGLWFIPTFHNITKLSPFLGAMCVLSLLWIVNELMNRKLMNADQMIQRRVPRVLQYGVIQMILFVLGIMLALGVVRETGFLNRVDAFMGGIADNMLVVGFATQIVGSVLDNFATLMSMVSLHDVAETGSNLALYGQNGAYWKIVAYATAMGGNILCIGSMSGLALMKMERIKLNWYFVNVGWVSFVASIAGMVCLWLLV